MNYTINSLSSNHYRLIKVGTNKVEVKVEKVSSIPSRNEVIISKREIASSLDINLEEDGVYLLIVYVNNSIDKHFTLISIEEMLEYKLKLQTEVLINNNIKNVAVKSYYDITNFRILFETLNSYNVNTLDVNTDINILYSISYVLNGLKRYYAN